MKNIFTITCTIILLLSIQLFSQEEEKEKADTLEYGLEEVTIVGTRTKENDYR